LTLDLARGIGVSAPLLVQACCVLPRAEYASFEPERFWQIDTKIGNEAKQTQQIEGRKIQDR
jgi:hypothetical protein